MKGTNTLFLNQATMIEALQEYFDKRYEPKISVISVKEGLSNSYDEKDTFKVCITDKIASS